jgi:plastocyanin
MAACVHAPRAAGPNASPVRAASLSGSVSAAGADSGAAPTIVFLEPIPRSGASRGGEDAELRIRRGRFEPSVRVVQRGQRVAWTNVDSIFHGVFSYSTGNAFDLDVFAPQERRATALAEVGPVVVRCPIHADERGIVYVAPSPYFAHARHERYALSSLPPGRYWLSAWSDGWVSPRREITLRAAEVARADLVLRRERN